MNVTGLGYDIHRFDPARPLVLGGVTIPGGPGLLGHSDADVLCHAIADALLGAVGQRDIGHHFPDTDESIRGISSLVILGRARELVREQGGRINNIDATLVAEAPKIAPHIPAIRESLAQAAGIEPARVAVKATTNETLGALGRREGMAALAVVSVELP